MMLTSRSFILVTALVAMPLVGALAQSNPSGNYGTNKATTASPGTADSTATSGLNTADVHSNPPGAAGSAVGNYTPGSTGHTVVPGSNSSVGTDTPNSAVAKTGGGVGGGSAGGGAGK